MYKGRKGFAGGTPVYVEQQEKQKWRYHLLELNSYYSSTSIYINQ